MASKVTRALAALGVLAATVFVLVEPAAAAGGTLEDPGIVYAEIDEDVVFDGAPDPYTGVPRKLEIEGGEEPFQCAHGDPDDGEIGTLPPPNQSVVNAGCFTAQFDLNNISNGLLDLPGQSGAALPSGAEILNATDLPAAVFNIFGTKAEINDALATLTFDPASDYETSYPTAGDPTFITLTIWDGVDERVAFVDDEGTVIDPDQITLDVRIEQPNDAPDLTIDALSQPIEVPAGGETVLSNNDANGISEFADEVFIEDPDIDDDEADDVMLLVAWLDGGNGLADFSLSPSVSPDCVTKLEEIIAQDDATDIGEPLEDRCDVLPGPIDLSLVPAGIPSSLSFTSSTQDQQAIAMLGRYNELDNIEDSVEDILSYIEFDAPPSGDCDCTITVVVSDLGNNGLPLPNVVQGVVLPFPGFDLETIDFKVRDAENDPPVVTPVPAGPTPVDELASVPVSFTVEDSDADDRDLTITSIATSGGTLSGGPTVPMSGSATALTAALTGMSFTASETVADPGAGSVTVTVQDNGNGPAPDPEANESGSGTATFTINEDGDPDIDPNPGVNDPPVLDAPAGIMATEGAVFAFNDAAIGVTDADAAADDLTLTITTTGDGATNEEGAHTGTLTELNTLLDGLTFTPTDDADFTDDVASIQVDVTDNGHNPDSDLPADEGTDSLAIDVMVDDDDIEPPEVNDPPVITAPPAAVVTEGMLSGFDSATIGVEDPDAGSDDLTLTITSTGGTTNADGVATGTLIELNAILDGLQYTAAQDPDTDDGVGSILLEVNDNGHNPDSNLPADEGTDSATVAFTILDDDEPPVEVNDPPVLTAPSSISVDEGLSFGFNPAAIGVADPDAGPDDLTLTITTTGDGSTNEEGVHSGTLAELEVVLDGLEFQTVQDVDTIDDVASILLSVNDNGHNPDSNVPAEEGTDTATIEVTILDDDVPPEANDPPTLMVPGALSVEVGATIAFTGGLQIVVDDPDAGGGDLALHVEATGGTLDPATADVTGTLAELQTFLDSLVFTAGATAGGATVTISVDDQGNTGTGGPLTASETIDITITEGEDPPGTTTTTPTPPGSVPAATTSTIAPASSTTTDPSGVSAEQRSATTTSTGSLPATGASVTLLVVAGAVLLAGGALVVVVVRRRWST